MNHTIKITVLAICAFSLTVFFTVYRDSISGGITGNTFNSIYESDRDNDCVINEVCCYNMVADKK